MKYPSSRLLIGAFNSKGSVIDFFDLIEDIQKLNESELEKEVLDCFQIYLQYNYNPDGEDEEVICKCLFIYEGEDWDIWVEDDKGNIFPINEKEMSSWFKQKIDGEIEKIESYD